MRYLSVCSGIEAATVAWHSLGWQAAGFSEIEPFPRAVLEERFGAQPVDWDHRHAPQSNVLPLFGDFTKIEPHHVGPVDLLVGGTPCQSFSVAGKRLGLDDPRGNLAIEFLALARRLRARWVVWENVPGVRSSWSGDAPGEPDMEAEPGRSEWSADYDESCDFAAFLDLFRECGYRGGWRSLDAQFVRVGGFERAVPQRRERVFAVGCLGDFARAATVLFERDSLRRNPAPRREARQDVAGTLAAGASRSRGAGTDPAGLTGEYLGFGGGNTSGPVPVAAALAAHGRRQDFEVETFVAHPTAATLTCGAETAGKGSYAGRRQEDDVNLVAHTLRGEGFDAGEDGTGRGTPIVPVQPFVLMSRGREGGHNLEFRQDGTANAILTPNGGRSGFGVGAIAYGWAVRRLTPRECERLQGFPDGWTAIPYRGKPAADGPRYKAIGNSMAVNVMRWLGERIEYVERACAAAGKDKTA